MLALSALTTESIGLTGVFGKVALAFPLSAFGAELLLDTAKNAVSLFIGEVLPDSALLFLAILCASVCPPAGPAPIFESIIMTPVRGKFLLRLRLFAFCTLLHLFL
jgi:hypothetical protein